MGDRAQVHIKDEKVWLYTHWGRSGLVEDVKRALAKRLRWNDPEYLARIIFEEMVGDQTGTETGFGIGCAQHGDVFDYVEINCENQTVSIVKMEYNEEYDMDLNNERQIISNVDICSFEEFVSRIELQKEEE